MNDIFTRAQPYLNYEENWLTKDIEKKQRVLGNPTNDRLGDNRRRDDAERDAHKGERVRFSSYTPINTQEKIFYKTVPTSNSNRLGKIPLPLGWTSKKIASIRATYTTWMKVPISNMLS